MKHRSHGDGDGLFQVDVKMVSRKQIEELYLEFERLRRGGVDSIAGLRELYPNVQAVVSTLGLKERFHKIHESTSGASYNLRFFASEEVSIALCIRGREHSFGDQEHADHFDLEFIVLAALAMNLRLRVDYAIDDLQEELLRAGRADEQ
ncbi:MAG: hypothetical protein KDK35_10095 [Leptospiraceae bacterium]|nr:hypothetical protein [Leptospiraceae bacterium]MCP5484298.1 hypothetical protein [Spirochaetales bacterium]